MKNVIFYDVETQNDFMNSDGTLYVPGAEALKENLKKLTDYALANRIQIFGGVDRHFPEDAELKRFPAHCMDSTDGQKKILETIVEGAAYIENRPYQPNELKLKRSAPAVYFEKQDTNVFSNANASRLKNYSAAVVYGVATDYCVKDAVMGMLARGLDVFIVKDAIRGVSEEATRKALDQMCMAGARFIITKNVLEGKVQERLAELWDERGRHEPDNEASHLSLYD